MITKDDLKKMGLAEQADGSWASATVVVKIDPVKEHLSQNKIGDKPKNLLITFLVDPMGKPRMTQSDKWKKRKVVQKYWVYKDMLVQTAKGINFIMPECNYWIFCYISMARSWSKKKKKEFADCPHKLKPDKDNIEKGILDALCKEDSHIWDGRITKIWCYEEQARIEIYQI